MRVAAEDAAEEEAEVAAEEEAEVAVAAEAEAGGGGPDCLWVGPVWVCN